MHQYASYKKSLDVLLAETSWGRKKVHQSVLHLHLNGGADARLRELVSRSHIRRSGAFFTGEVLGRQLVEFVPNDYVNGATAWDPTCGAGDLLLRWSERLPVSEDLRETLLHWGECLHGQDIHPEFIAVAKRRLALAAIGRGACLQDGHEIRADHLFPNLQSRNLLRGKVCVPDSSVILMNPPFTMISTPIDCRAWSSGRVAFAAVALFRCLSAASQGQRIAAILPDVLRSGTRYAEWRRNVEKLAVNANVCVVGKFSSHADVDVFLFSVEVGTPVKTGIDWFGQEELQSHRTLDSFCEIHVGSVVPHRHIPTGPNVPYLTTTDSPPWSEMSRVKSVLRFEGKRVKGPFLAIRRTSSPSDDTRAIATLLNTKQSVALENHLISVRPHDGTIETCRKLQHYLKTKVVRDWLDHRIRCRHLTVSAIRQLPVPSDL